MEKQITITLSERKARTLFDTILVSIKQLDKLYEENQSPRTRQAADDLEVIMEDLRSKVYF